MSGQRLMSVQWTPARSVVSRGERAIVHRDVTGVAPRALGGRVAAPIAAVLLFGSLLGCRSNELTGVLDDSATERSPNARILPAPLKGAANRGKSGASGGRGQLDVVVPEPFPVDAPLEKEAAGVGTSSGFELNLEWWLPEVRRAEELGSQGERARAGFVVQVLPKSDDGSVQKAARQRVQLSGALFHLPEGTELRSRADRFGFIVVWPDGRSYRTVPRGALSNLLQERRVDVMPSFEAVVPAAESLMRDGQKLVVRRVQSPLGELVLTSSEQSEWGESTRLFCEILVELIRVVANDEICRGGELPVEVRYSWASGGELRGTVGGVRRRADLDFAVFELPPQMSIFKPGELPPDDELPWQGKVAAALFPAHPGPALVFKNVLDVPLLLMIDGVPARRLDPWQEWQFSPGKAGRHYSARDFLGQSVRTGGPLSPPALVHLGASPEVQPELGPAPVNTAAP